MIGTFDYTAYCIKLARKVSANLAADAQFFPYIFLNSMLNYRQ